MLTRDAPAPFGCEQIVGMQFEQEDQSAGGLTVPKLSAEMIKDNAQGPSGSGPNKEQEDEDKENRQTDQTDQPMEQDANQT